ncbi:MAG TPA: hypothetical protein VGL91_17090 [Acidobacteriota bacterium]|jgi:hypothetical protein
MEAVPRVCEPERIAIVDLADDLQVRKQRIFKILPRLGIRPTQRREASRGNQNVATVSQAEAIAIRAEIEKSAGRPSDNSSLSAATAAFYSDDVGFFYLIQLEPEHDPGRFKLGFTMDLDGRLQKHRCSAPFAQYVGTWPCKRVWERAAIDCVTNACAQLHTEVFRAASLEQIAALAKSFFSIMPNLDEGSGDDQEPETDEQAG